MNRPIDGFFNGGGAAPVGSELTFPDNLPVKIVTGGQEWLQSGYVETDQAKFDAAFWDYTRATVWSKSSAWSGRANIAAASNLNTVVVAASATTAPAQGGVFVSTDGGLTFGSIVSLSNYASNESANNVAWVQSFGLWIVISSAGKIHTSPDAVTWTERTSGTTNSLVGFSFANGVLVVVGASGTILTSANGTTYTVRTSNVTGVGFNSVAYYSGVWLAVSTSEASKGSRSTDNGVTWVAVTVTPTGFTNIVSVIASDLGFIAVVSSGGGGVFKSTTGATGSWTYVGHKSLGLTSPTYNGEFYLFRSGGNIYKSYDLVEMRIFSFGLTTIQRVLAVGGKFLCCANDGVSDSALYLGNTSAYAGNPTRNGTNVVGISMVSYVRIK